MLKPSFAALAAILVLGSSVTVSAAPSAPVSPSEPLRKLIQAPGQDLPLPPGDSFDGLPRPDELAPPDTGPGLGAAPEPPAAREAPAAGQRVQTAPKNPQDRDAMLSELYVHLAEANDATQAEPISKTIEKLWAYTDSATTSLLMNRAATAVADKRYDLAQQLLDAVVELDPAYAEGWNRRAYVYYLQNDYEHAVGDLRRTLALDPNHYKALEGLARILSDSGQKKSALGAYKQLLRINPYMPGAAEAAKELSLEVEGRGI